PWLSRWWVQVPDSRNLTLGRASQRTGSLPGGPGPARAQAWATARPSGPVIVRHRRAPGPADRAAARSRQVAASAGPYPATSPGVWVRPCQADSGIVRFTVPDSPAGTRGTSGQGIQAPRSG